MPYLPHCLHFSSGLNIVNEDHQKYLGAGHRTSLSVYAHLSQSEHQENMVKIAAMMKEESPPIAWWVYPIVALGLCVYTVGLAPRWHRHQPSIVTLSIGRRWLRNLFVWFYIWTHGPYSGLTAIGTGIPWAEDEVLCGQIPVWEKLGIPVALIYHHGWRRRFKLRGWLKP